MDGHELDHERLLWDERYFLAAIDGKSTAKGRFGPALWKFVQGKPPTTLRVVHPKRTRVSKARVKMGINGSLKLERIPKASIHAGGRIGRRSNDDSDGSSYDDDDDDENNDYESDHLHPLDSSRHTDQVPLVPPLSAAAAASTNPAVAAVVAAAAAATNALRDSVRSAFKSVKKEPNAGVTASEFRSGGPGGGERGGAERDAFLQGLTLAPIRTDQPFLQLGQKRKTVAPTDDNLSLGLSDLSRFVPSSWPTAKKVKKTSGPKLKLGEGLTAENPQSLAHALLRLSQSLDE